ncbi:hypothetical protein, partial [Streptomyces albogriseolus]|uniref:hypothetical protein n=1 Tax=Streptomyces albogriseolus TaxID=1887 RepID=UPI00345F316B
EISPDDLRPLFGTPVHTFTAEAETRSGFPGRRRRSFLAEYGPREALTRKRFPSTFRSST